MYLYMSGICFEIIHLGEEESEGTDKTKYGGVILLFPLGYIWKFL